MDIDLSLLHSKTVDKVYISGTYNIPKEYYNEEALSCDNIKVEGYVYLGADYDDVDEEMDYIKADIKGTLVLEDSISLEPIDYEININYDDILEENCKKSENILDIFQFLWENIVLEIPLKVTKVEDLSKFHGDGWKLISEDDLVKSDNPFNELLKDFKEE